MCSSTATSLAAITRHSRWALPSDRCEVRTFQSPLGRPATIALPSASVTTRRTPWRRSTGTSSTKMQASGVPLPSVLLDSSPPGIGRISSPSTRIRSAPVPWATSGSAAMRSLPTDADSFAAPADGPCSGAVTTTAGPCSPAPAVPVAPGSSHCQTPNTTNITTSAHSTFFMPSPPATTATATPVPAATVNGPPILACCNTRSRSCCSPAVGTACAANDGANAAASPAGSTARSACSPRCNRMRTAPGAMPSTSAISAGCSPYCNCSSNTCRCSSGSASMWVRRRATSSRWPATAVGSTSAAAASPFAASAGSGSPRRRRSRRSRLRASPARMPASHGPTGCRASNAVCFCIAITNVACSASSASCALPHRCSASASSRGATRSNVLPSASRSPVRR